MTAFREEIEQMPAALDLLVSYYEGDGRERLRDLRSRLRGARDLLWAGMGTSRFAPEAAFPRLRRAGFSCRSADAGEWLHYEEDAPPAADGPADRPAHGSADAPAVVLTSQSGESVEVRRLVEQGRVPPGFIAITNNLDSFLARRAGLALPLLAGDEAAISNKTYANTLALVSLMASALEGDASLAQCFVDLRAASRALRDADMEAIAAAAARLAPASGIAFVGRGPAFVTARQCALTFMEGTRCLASAFTGGAFNHGPAELLAQGFRLVVMQAAGRTRALNASLAARAAGLGADVVLMSAAAEERIDGVLTVPVPSIAARPRGQEELFPLLASRVQNLLLDRVAAGRGLEAGVFRHGTKVTTHE